MDVEDDDDIECCFCGYEPSDPGGIYSEIIDANVCIDCEQIAVRVLSTAAEAGFFRIRSALFEVRLRASDDVPTV
jgi:hypothetical protein